MQHRFYRRSLIQTRFIKRSTADFARAKWNERWKRLHIGCCYCERYLTHSHLTDSPNAFTLISRYQGGRGIATFCQRHQTLPRVWERIPRNQRICRLSTPRSHGTRGLKANAYFARRISINLILPRSQKECAHTRRLTFIYSIFRARVGKEGRGAPIAVVDYPATSKSTWIRLQGEKSAYAKDDAGCTRATSVSAGTRVTCHVTAQRARAHACIKVLPTVRGRIRSTTRSRFLLFFAGAVEASRIDRPEIHERYVSPSMNVGGGCCSLENRTVGSDER